MRKLVTILAAAALCIPSMAAAASGPIDIGSKLDVGQIQIAAADNMVRTVTVPLKLDNMSAAIVAMDIPLSFGQRSDQIELVDVTYASRVDYFDVKVTNIDNDAKTVVLGLIAMAYDPNTPDLAQGDGPIAYFTFEVADPNMESFTLAATEMERPSHRLMLVSHDNSSGAPEVVWEEPGFDYNVDLSAGSGLTPSSYALNQNYPNPFNAGTVIGFDMPVGGEWSLRVYNLLGQMVRTFDGVASEGGSVAVPWDGTDRHGQQVSSGVYFYRLQANDFRSTKKMTLLK